MNSTTKYGVLLKQTKSSGNGPGLEGALDFFSFAMNNPPLFRPLPVFSKKYTQAEALRFVIKRTRLCFIIVSYFILSVAHATRLS